jgi:hypothetical protein
MAEKKEFIGIRLDRYDMERLVQLQRLADESVSETFRILVRHTRPEQLKAYLAEEGRR